MWFKLDWIIKLTLLIGFGVCFALATFFVGWIKSLVIISIVIGAIFLLYGFIRTLINYIISFESELY